MNDGDKLCEKVRKDNPCTVFDGMQIRIAILENSVGVPQNN